MLLTAQIYQQECYTWLPWEPDHGHEKAIFLFREIHMVLDINDCRYTT